MNQAVPHHIQAQHYAKMIEQPATEVVLEPGRGRVGGEKLTLDVALWGRIKDLALPRCELGDDRTVLPVVEAAIFVTALKANEAKTEGWTRRDREAFKAVLALLYQHNGLVISKR